LTCLLVLILTGAQAEVAVILKAVAMDTGTVETVATEPAVETTTAIAPWSGDYGIPRDKRRGAD
jgi:hypothetical protein